MKVFALGNNLLVTGMRLAGIPGKVVTGGPELQKEIERLTGQESYGILFIGLTEAQEIKDFIQQYRLARAVPVLLEVPDGRSSRPPNHLADFLSASLGVKV